jgi:WD40-like Beta Propeller Repeat
VVSVQRGGGGEARRPRFPALDPEPPPSARYKRVARNAAITAVALVAVLGLARGTAYLVTSHGHPHAAAKSAAGSAHEASAAPPAKIVALNQMQDVALSNLRGGPATTLSSLGQMTASPTATLDNRYVVNPYAEVITFSAQGRPAVTPMKGVNANQWIPASIEPLAGHDRYAVLLNDGVGWTETSDPISVSSLATGATVSLGQGDNVAGDPAAAGAFASVAAPIQATANPGAANVFPDGKVVLRDAGRPQVLLATIAQLNSDLHLPADTQAALFPYPDPSGGMVAAAVQPTDGADGGIVILTRTGHEVTEMSGGSPSWSPSGRSLAFVASDAQGSALDIWSTDGQRTSQKFPASGGSPYTDCLWSPDGAWILCAVGGAHATGEDWVVASASGGPMVVTRGPGFPIAWLGGTQ